MDYLATATTLYCIISIHSHILVFWCIGKNLSSTCRQTRMVLHSVGIENVDNNWFYALEWNNRIFIRFIQCKLWRCDDFHFISLSLVFRCLFELLTVDAKLSRINEMQCISNQHKSKHNKRLSYFKKTRAITWCTLQFPFCKLEKPYFV